MKTLKVKLLTKDAKLPTRAHMNDAGIDIYATKDISCPRGERCSVSTGIAIEIEKGYFAMVSDKSSMARSGFKVNAGVVDAGYTGEVSVEIMNLTGTEKVIKKGQKVAQLIILPIALPSIESVDSLEESERGDQGWGSSGAF